MTPRTTLDLRRSPDASTLIVTLNRPANKNAFDAVMMRELTALWHDADALEGVRAIVITGAGDAFCAGADVGMLHEGRTDVGRDARAELAFLPRHAVDVPVIAAVNGVCAGGGLHFVAEADIAIASPTASFVDPHVSVGQVSALEPVMLAPRMRFDLITRMALLGRSERLTAEQALHGGLVSEVVENGSVLDRALELAAQIAQNSPAAVAATRRALIDFETSITAEVLDRGWQAIQAHWTHPDATEGPAAFLDKRAPRWVASDPS